jgi:hypothetical protein
VLLGGLLLLLVADFVLAFAGSVAWVPAGVAVRGLHKGSTQGVFAELVAAAPREVRGSAFGVVHLDARAALLLANLGAGHAWTPSGAQAPYVIEAGFAALATAGLFTLRDSGINRA